MVNFGFGVVFDRGEVTAFGADFAVRCFAGPGAGAVIAGLMEADRRLGPILGFFHRHNLRCRAEGGRQVFIPWLTARRNAKIFLL